MLVGVERKGDGRAVRSRRGMDEHVGARPLHGDLVQPSSYVAGRVAARATAAPAHPAAAWDRARDPYRDTVASSIPPFSVFCKLLPKVELKSNFG